jgi:hypothetical protein
MDILNFTSSELHRNIRELLDNLSATHSIKRMSEIYRDQPMIGREKAAIWIDHVIKYGSNHLRSPASNMPLYEFFMFDILVLVGIVLLILITIITCVFRQLLLRCIRHEKAKMD